MRDRSVEVRDATARKVPLNVYFGFSSLKLALILNKNIQNEV
jgi:hypothetical protein